MRIAKILCCTLLFGTPALADDVYETYSHDKLVGTETVNRPAPNGDLRSRTEVTVEGVTVTFVQEGKLDATGRRLASYQCDIQTPQGPARVRAKLGEAGWTLDAGTGGDAAPAETKTFPASPSTIVLDNNLASHLDLLCRDLVVNKTDAATYTALVPQVLASVPVQAKKVVNGAGTVRYRVEAANILIDMICREGDGMLLEATVPIQSARYKRKDYVSAAPPPQAPAPDPRERSTVVKGPAGDLAAVLTIPKADKPVAAVLMLSGSGPNDRDETIGPNKPFRDIALGLADGGVATLRFDKRTVTLKDASKSATIRDEYVVDALEAMKVLRAAEGVDPKHIFVLGHSLGTVAAPLVAKEAGKVRGLVLLAGPGRPLDALLHDQTIFQMKLAGQDQAAIDQHVGKVDAAFARLRSDPASQDPILGAPAGYWRDVLNLDLATLVRDSKLPALLVQGEKDVQVSKTLDFDALRAKLGSAPRFTYKTFPTLNHLLMPVSGEGTGAEYGIEGHVDPAVVQAIVSWIKEN
jgi:pimeloyl-ACP methyl ester carboxylesterase